MSELGRGPLLPDVDSLVDVSPVEAEGFFEPLAAASGLLNDYLVEVAAKAGGEDSGSLHLNEALHHLAIARHAASEARDSLTAYVVCESETFESGA